MDGRGKWIARCLAVLVFFADVRAATASPELQRSWRDDAALHDVKFVSARHGWAVGDHGALWRTADGGQSWTLTETGTTATLRSICLLTDQVGWIAGWQVQGSPELTSGVLLATRDGGQNWESLAMQSLSPLRYVKFFGFVF